LGLSAPRSRLTPPHRHGRSSRSPSRRVHDGHMRPRQSCSHERHRSDPTRRRIVHLGRPADGVHIDGCYRELGRTAITWCRKDRGWEWHLVAETRRLTNPCAVALHARQPQRASSALSAPGHAATAIAGREGPLATVARTDRATAAPVSAHLCPPALLTYPRAVLNLLERRTRCRGDPASAATRNDRAAAAVRGRTVVG
jgi:hypothetical protein